MAPGARSSSDYSLVRQVRVGPLAAVRALPATSFGGGERDSASAKFDCIYHTG